MEIGNDVEPITLKHLARKRGITLVPCSTVVHPTVRHHGALRGRRCRLLPGVQWRCRPRAEASRRLQAGRARAGVHRQLPRGLPANVVAATAGQAVAMVMMVRMRDAGELRSS
jgi:hypothetical protein